MTVSDPEGRELVLSCVAALYNFRLAARTIGFDPEVELLPEPAQPRLLARVTLHPGAPAIAEERGAYAALTRRHTHRGQFGSKPVAPDLAVYLQQAADAEGAVLIFVHQPGQRRRISQLAVAAEHAIATNPRVQEEVAAWTPRPQEQRRDGVPVTAYPARPRLVAGGLPARDFDQGRGLGRAELDTSAPGLIAILATPNDTQRDWLVAGQAMERALIRAAQEWAFAALDSQLVEVASTRSELRRALGMRSYPQLVLRFGYAASAAATPRRPVDDVLDIGVR